MTRKYLNFNWTYFYISRVRCHVTFKLTVFHLWQTNFASFTRSRPQFRTGRMQCIIICRASAGPATVLTPEAYCFRYKWRQCFQGQFYRGFNFLKW